MGNVFIAISQTADAIEIKSETNDKSVSIDDLGVSVINSPINRRLTLFEEDSISPVIVCGDDDVLHMAWIDSRVIDFNSSQIFTSIFYKQSHDFGNTWTPDTVLSTRITDAMSIDLAVDGKYLAIAWEEGCDVFTIFSYDNGNSWAEPYPIYSIESPSIALKGNDVYIVFKDNSQVGVPYLSGKKLTINPELSTPVPYDFNPAGDDQICSIADVTTDDNAVQVVIKDQTNTELHYYKSQDNGTTWSGGVIGDSFGEDALGSVKITNKEENVNIIWSDNRDGDYDLYMKSSNDYGETWASTMKLTESIGKSTTVDVALNSKSEVNLCWEEKSETSNKIYYGHFDSSGNELSLNSITNGTSASSKPTIAFDSNDYYYMLWQDDRDNEEEIYYSTNLGEFDKQMDSILINIELLPNECFAKPQYKNTLLSQFEAVRTQLDENAYTGALNKLENVIMKKMDGYLNENSKDDWIVDFRVQQDLSDLISGLLIGIKLKTVYTEPIGGSQWCDVGTVMDTLVQLGPQINGNYEWSGFQTLLSRTCRSGVAYSNFWINIENTASAKNIDYRITFSFYASANIEVKQLSGPSWENYQSIGKLPGNGNWRTYSLDTNYRWNYDYNTANSWCNILFEFEAPLFLDSISVVPVKYYCDVTAVDANSFAAHNPGINIHPYLGLTWASTPTTEGGHTYRIGDFNTNQWGPKFWINLFNDPMSQPSMQCEYRLEISYKILGPAINNPNCQPYIQQWDGTKYLNVLKLNSDGEWHTSIGIPIKTGYYDYGTSSDWGQSVPNCNVIFQIGLLKSDGSSATLVQADIIGVGSLSITVARNYCDVGTSNDNVATAHEPGVSIYPFGWNSGQDADGTYKSAVPLWGDFYLNGIDTGKDYVIRIRYKSSYAGTLKQWDGWQSHPIGTYQQSGNICETTFIAKAFWFYDYAGYGNTYEMNAVFSFSTPITLYDVSVGVMEKYAILVGGGSIDPSENYDAFKNDLFEMYNGLKGYNGWKEENIFCYLWNQPAATYFYNSKQIVLDGMATNENIQGALKEIGNQITTDDFFYFFEVSHGGVGLPGVYGDKGFFRTYSTYPANNQIYFIELGQWLNNYIGNKWMRSLFVFASCNSGHAISEIHVGSTMQRAIVISAVDVNEEEKTWKYCWGFNSPLAESDNHIEFLYNDAGNGFIRSIGNNYFPQTILDAFRSGYDAGTEVDVYVPWPAEPHSHALLDDNWDLIGSKKGDLDVTNPTKDGSLSMVSIF